MISNELNTIVTQIKQQGKMSFLAGATENQIEEFEKNIPRCVCLYHHDIGASDQTQWSSWQEVHQQIVRRCLYEW